MRSTPPLSSTAARIRPPVFAALQARIDRLAEKAIELVPLQIGDTWLAPPPGARRVLAELDAQDLSLYRYGPTAGLPALREAFARRVRAHGREVELPDPAALDEDHPLPLDVEVVELADHRPRRGLERPEQGG